jgi:hypothetical protein
MLGLTLTQVFVRGCLRRVSSRDQVLPRGSQEANKWASGRSRMSPGERFSSALRASQTPSKHVDRLEINFALSAYSALLRILDKERGVHIVQIQTDGQFDVVVHVRQYVPRFGERCCLGYRLERCLLFE